MCQLCCTSGEHDESDGVKRKYLGPARNRSCTDIPCCIFFGIMVLCFVSVLIWSYAMGDYRRLLHPTNSRGQICGRDIPDKPFLYFFDLQKCITRTSTSLMLGCPTPQVCVAKCPDYYWLWKMESSKNKSLMICLNGTTGDNPEFADETIEQLVVSKKCAPYIIRSKPILGRCMPSELSKLLKKGTNVVFGRDTEVNGTAVARGQRILLEFVSIFEKIVRDLKHTWSVILICLGLSILLSFAWIVLMRCFATIIVWTSIVLFIVIFGSGTFYSFRRWYILPKPTEIDDFEPISFIKYYTRLPATWLTLGIIAAVITALAILIIIFLRNRIRIAIGILNVTSKAVASMTSVLFWPLLPLILELCVIAICLFVAISLRTIASPVGTEGVEPASPTSRSERVKQEIKDIIRHIPCDPMANGTAGKACRFLYYGDRKYTIFLHLFNLLMFLWMLNFVKALTQMILASSFAHYYFSRLNPSTMPACPIIAGFKQCLFYHSGSLALGSFLLTLLQWLRALLEYIDNKLKRVENPITMVLKKICFCCLWCFEKFLKFLNRNAYIMIAIHGRSFCFAAGDALGLLSRNIVRLFVVDKVADFVIFLGKIVVVCIVGAIAYMLLDESFVTNIEALDALKPTLNYTFVPFAIILISAYMVATLFTSVYEMGVDTIFLCFLEDLEHNDGSAERPYYMSKELMGILSKENESPKGAAMS